MKTFKILLAFLLLTPFTFQSCQDDITDLDDPRDGITKLWRVTETGSGRNYDVTITKHPDEDTKVLLSNFHDLGTADKLEATMAGTNLTVAKQVLDGTYTIDGEAAINTTGDFITFDYTVDDGDGPQNFGANYGNAYVKKKKTPVVALK